MPKINIVIARTAVIARAAVLAGTVVLIGGLAGCSTASPATPGALGKPASQSTAATAPSAGASAAAAAGTTGAACDLVSPADVSTAVGKPVTVALGSEYDCAYAGDDASQQLIVHIFADQTNMNNLVQQIELISTHIDGLGDDAFWNGVTGTMFVRSGTRGFTISTNYVPARNLSDPAGAKAAMVTLATTALSHF
jgi:hypothetical protein